MDIKIQAIHFDATEKLNQFIEKKVSKLEKFGGETGKVEVSLKVVKPETAMNKEVAIRLQLSAGPLNTPSGETLTAIADLATFPYSSSSESSLS